MTKPELKTAPLSIRIRPSLKAALELLASENRRPLAQFVELVLEEHVNSEMNSTSKAKKLPRSAAIVGGGILPKSQK